MTPADPGKCPFRDFRLVVPIRLATNPWTTDGAGIGLATDLPVHETPGSAYSVPSSPSEGGI